MNWCGTFEVPLDCNRALAILSKLDFRDARQILDALEDGGRSIRDPLSFIVNSAKKRQTSPSPSQKRAAAFSIEPPRASPPQRRPQVSLPLELRRRIWQLNESRLFNIELRYDRLARALQPLSEQDAMSILQDLEDNSATVADPNAYVLKAARRSDSGDNSGDNSGDAETTNVTEVDMKLRKRIGWLNNNINFEKPLMYWKVAPELCGIGLQAAFTILKKLESEANHTLADPTDWVLAAVRDSNAPRVGFLRGS